MSSIFSCTFVLSLSLHTQTPREKMAHPKIWRETPGKIWREKMTRLQCFHVASFGGENDDDSTRWQIFGGRHDDSTHHLHVEIRCITRGAHRFHPAIRHQPRPPSTYPMGIHDTVTRAIAYLIKEHLLLPKNSSTMCLSEESSSQKVLSTDLSYQPN
jgi:hypothetical protein